jgi:uncharacterized protein YciI
MREQDGWGGHAEFMDGLADRGIVLLGGPVGDGDRRFLLVVEADGPEAVERILASDPWVAAGRLETETIEPWRVLLRAGAEA